MQAADTEFAASAPYAESLRSRTRGARDPTGHITVELTGKEYYH